MLWPKWWMLLNLTQIPHSYTQNVNVGWNTCSLKFFFLGRMYVAIICYKKSLFCFKFFITSHKGVWIHDNSIDKAQLPHTFNTHTSLYKRFTITELHCGNQAFLTDPKDWLGLIKQEYGFPEVYIL